MKIILTTALLFLFSLPLAAGNGFALPVTNIFFQPSGGDFLLQLDMLNYKEEGQKVNFPQQMISGSPVPVEANTDIQAKSFFADASLRYALTDRFILGFTGKYMYDYSHNQTSSSTFAAATSTSKSGAGFYDPGFFALARFGGTEREDRFLDLELSYAPGMSNPDNKGYIVPNNAIGVRLAIGKNLWDFTYGVVFVGRYWQRAAEDLNDALNERVLAGFAAFAQWDFDDFFIRFSAGGYRNVDAASANSALRRQVTPNSSLRLGFPVSEDTVLSTQIEYAFSVSAPYQQNGLNGTFTNAPQITVAGSLTTRF